MFMMNILENLTGGEWVANVFGRLLEIVPRILNILWSGLCVPAYYSISLFFNVFNLIPQMNLLQHIEIEQIYQRLTMIIVIVMAFYITFEVVKYVVQPDTITDKSKGAGNIVLRMIIVILLIAFVPRIFTLAYDVQGKIINTNVISKVILGNHVDAKDGVKISTAGSEFAADLFSLFYHLNEEACPLTETGEIDKSFFTNNNVAYENCKEAKIIVDMNLEGLRSGWMDNPTSAPIGATLGGFARNIGLARFNVSKTNGIEFCIEFAGLLALVVGLVVIWVLIVYGMEIARRYFQLIYLQIMAPIAIMGYLSPKKDGTLSKWAKQCLTTYLDLFIRLAIINFILLLVNILHTSFFDTESMLISIFGGNTIGNAVHFDVYIFVYIFLIIGLFMFALKAPKLLKELFPTSGAAAGEFGLIEPTKKIISGASRTIGGVVGAYSGAKIAYNSNHFKNKGDKFLAGAKGMFAGAKAGFAKGGNLKKAKTAAAGSVHKDEDTVLSGGTVMGSTFHGHAYAQKLKEKDREIADFQQAKAGMDQMSAHIDEFKQVKTIKKAWKAAEAAGNTKEALRLEAQYKSLSQALRGAIVQNDGNLEGVTIKYSYSDIDEKTGKPIGTKVDAEYMYDDGDKAFAKSFLHVATEEREKTQGTALDEVSFEEELGEALKVKRPKINPTTGTVERDANNEIIMEEVLVKTVGELTAAEYAQYIHKVKDAAFTKETKTKDKEYAEAKANAQASGKSGE